MRDELARATQIRGQFDDTTAALMQQMNQIFSQSIQVGRPATVSSAGRSLQSLMNSIVASKQYFDTANPDALTVTFNMLTSFDRALRQLEALNQQDQIDDWAIGSKVSPKMLSDTVPVHRLAW